MRLAFLTICLILGCLTWASEYRFSIGDICIRYNDPVFKTKEEVQTELAKAYQAKEVLKALQYADLSQENSKDVDMALRLTERFINFAEAGTLIEFSTTNDPAITNLRNNLDLPVPPGFAYVVTGVSLKDFDSKDKAQHQGLTIYTRYILIEPDLKINSDGTSKSKGNDTLSHELVHAYTNALVGLKDDDLPKWFYEGLASYLAKNKIKEVTNVKMEDDGTVVTTSEVMPEDYQNNLLIMQYLSRIKGKKRFYAFIKQSISERTVEKSVVSLAGTSDEKKLLQMAKDLDMETKAFYGLTLAWSLWVLIYLSITRWIIKERQRYAVEEEMKAYYTGGDVADAAYISRHITHTIVLLGSTICLFFVWKIAQMIWMSWFG